MSNSTISAAASKHAARTRQHGKAKEAEREMVVHGQHCWKDLDDDLKQQAKDFEIDLSRYRVRPGEKVRLRDWDPSDTKGLPKSEELLDACILYQKRKLSKLQKLLHTCSLVPSMQPKKYPAIKYLCVAQSPDGTEKDHLWAQISQATPHARKVDVGAPSKQELSHDYAWRIHKEMPADYEIVYSNRSIYEDIIAVRVHNLLPEERWSKRYDHIVNLESMWVDEGMIIDKIYTNKRDSKRIGTLIERLDEPHKNAKFSDSDEADAQPKVVKATREAYQDVLSRTSTKKAPWYIVPGDNEKVRDLIAFAIMVDSLKTAIKERGIEYPQMDPAKVKKMRSKLEVHKAYFESRGQ